VAQKRVNYRFERAERERLQAERRAKRDQRKEERHKEEIEAGTAASIATPGVTPTDGV
jgi:hypothetical protein